MKAIMAVIIVLVYGLLTYEFSDSLERTTELYSMSPFDRCMSNLSDTAKCKFYK